MDIVMKPSLRATLLAMERDQSVDIDFGIWSQNSIRNNACNTGTDYNRKYKVEIYREARKYHITRTL